MSSLSLVAIIGFAGTTVVLSYLLFHCHHYLIATPSSPLFGCCLIISVINVARVSSIIIIIIVVTISSLFCLHHSIIAISAYHLYHHFVIVVSILLVVCVVVIIVNIDGEADSMCIAEAVTKKNKLEYLKCNYCTINP